MQQIKLQPEGLIASSVAIDPNATINDASEIGTQGKSDTPPSIWD